MHSKPDLSKLQRSVEWALRNELPSAELVRMLRPLVNATEPATPSGCHARLQLAEHLLLAKADTSSAWQACSLLRSVVQASRDPEQLRRAHGARGLALSVLGHLRSARAAYREALAIDPSDPVCAHNLGHLESVHFGAHHSALRWLRVAHLGLPGDPEIAASLAHALCRAGYEERALRVLRRSSVDADRARQLVRSWSTRSVTPPVAVQIAP